MTGFYFQDRAQVGGSGAFFLYPQTPQTRLMHIFGAYAPRCQFAKWQQSRSKFVFFSRGRKTMIKLSALKREIGCGLTMLEVLCTSGMWDGAGRDETFDKRNAPFDHHLTTVSHGKEGHSPVWTMKGLVAEMQTEEHKQLVPAVLLLAFECLTESVTGNIYVVIHIFPGWPLRGTVSSSEPECSCIP